MKISKIILLLVISLFFASCSQDFEQSVANYTDDKEAIQNSSIRTEQDAIDIVNNLLADSSFGVKRSRTTKIAAVHAVTSNRSRAICDTLMYAVDLGEDEGFVLVSAPLTVDPILAITEAGSFDGEETLQNRAFQSALARAKMYVARSSGSGIIIPPTPEDTTPFVIKPRFYYDTVKVEESVIPNMLDTKWGQRWPMNEYCPNKIVGCVPLAVAEVLSAFNVVNTYSYTFVERDVDSEVVDWGVLKKHIKGSRNSIPTVTDEKFHAHCPLSAEGHKTLARAVRHIGRNVRAQYDEDGTEAPHMRGEAFLVGALPNVSRKRDFGGTSLYNEMRKTPGIAYVGGVDYSDPDNEYGLGHSWVIDGAWEKRYYLNKYVIAGNGDGSYRYDSSIVSKKEYLHCNWGWNGVANGYFKKDLFVTDRGVKYDEKVLGYPVYNLTEDFEYCLFIK